MTLGSGLATHYSVSCIVSVAGIGPAPLAKAVGASGGCRSGLKTRAGGASRDLAWAFRRSSPRKNAIHSGAKDRTGSLEVHTLQAVGGKLCGNPGRPTREPDLVFSPVRGP